MFEPAAEESSSEPLCSALEVAFSVEPESACEPPTALDPSFAFGPLCFWSDGEIAGALALTAANAASDRELARTSLKRAEASIADGKLADALLQLRVVERSLPTIADRIALERGDLLLRLELPEQARAAYALASGSPDRGVAARAAIGSVRSAIAIGDSKAEQAMQSLLARYPLLPERHQLDFELALARMRAGSLPAAAALLRRIDLESPASGVAARARAELAKLAEAGVRVQPFAGGERVDRAERLLREGPIDLAAAEVEALASVPLSAEARARLHLLAARIARVQGRFDEMDAVLQAARGGSGASPDAAKLTPPAAVAGAPTQEHAEAERRVRSIRGSKPIAKLNNAQVRAVFDIAARNGLRELVDETVEAMATRKGFLPPLRFEAAMLASGLASDDKLAKLLETLLSVPSYRVSARYHFARALERLGRFGDAEAEYLKVIAQDRGATRYYAMWADQRMWSMKSSVRGSCVPVTSAGDKLLVAAAQEPASPAVLACGAALVAQQGVTITPAQQLPPEAAAQNATFALIGTVLEQGQGPALADQPEPNAGSELEQLEGLQDAVLGPVPAPKDTALSIKDPALRRIRALELLTPIAQKHTEAYPWLLRAVDLIELERFEEAADELSEAYLAFRDATNAPRLRSGLVALMTGNAPPRRAITPALRRARRTLDPKARKTLSQVARVVGDPGIGLRFGDFRLNEHPRAYANLVERAAHQHGLDPNLLFAVMRVESIYNRRIISMAGAIGLMQIMPHTGQRIAGRLGVDGFEVSDLLDPELNVNFSAWYLASLLKRFDGRLPLAIASYNGGPHNVRLWMRSSPPDMPLDAFLERIPFTETHRYVRRVLTHYAAYRAQQNLPMTRLSVELPRPQPDDIAF